MILDGSGHEGAAVLLPGFAISWWQNQVTRQPHLRDLTQIQNEREALITSDARDGIF